MGEPMSRGGRVELDSRRSSTGGVGSSRGTTGEGMGPRIREDKGWGDIRERQGMGSFSRGEGSRGGGIKAMRGTDMSVEGETGFPPSSSRGDRFETRIREDKTDGGGGMGPRIREDNGRGKWVPRREDPTGDGGEGAMDGMACVGGGGDGSPHPRGQRGGRAPRRDGPNRVRGGDGSPHPRGQGGGEREFFTEGRPQQGTEEGMGPRIREDTEGMGGSSTGGTALREDRERDGSPHPRGHGKGAGRQRDSSTPLRYVQNGMCGRGLWTEWHVWEVTGGDGAPHPRGHGGGVGETATMRVVAKGYGRGDGSPHPRGQRMGRCSRTARTG